MRPLLSVELKPLRLRSLDTVRCEHASRLLQDTDCRIIDVAFSSGYTDPAHFSRAFRRMTGVTPRQFREQSRLG